MLLGGLRVAGAVGDDGGIAELLFQFAIANEQLLEDRPHGRGASRVGHGGGRATDPEIDLLPRGGTHGFLLADEAQSAAVAADRRKLFGGFGASAASPVSPGFLRLSQLYLLWNFSTRPVVSTNFILPVKNGWQAEQISTVMFFFVLRVTNLLPQPQVTVASTYSG